MDNKQEVWTAMIICGYAKRLGITISEAAGQLLDCGAMGYLEECYEALHTQSNEDVISELADMAGSGVPK